MSTFVQTLSNNSMQTGVGVPQGSRRWETIPRSSSRVEKPRENIVGVFITARMIWLFAASINWFIYYVTNIVVTCIIRS